MQSSQITIYGPASNLKHTQAHTEAMGMVTIRAEEMHSFVIYTGMNSDLHRQIRSLAEYYWFWEQNRDADGNKLEGIKLSFIDESDSVYVRMNIAC